MWKSFNNKFWPAHYFVDAKGKIRGHHFGEGKYARSERTIRQLLTEAGAKNLPEPLDDAAGAGVSAASDTANVASPETYVGFERAANFALAGRVRARRGETLRGAGDARAQPVGASGPLEGAARARDARGGAGPHRVPLPRA